MQQPTVEDLVRHALTADLELYDVEVSPGSVRVLVERPGGVDLEALTVANRLVSAALDAGDPISGRYTLEVSSPGLERPLRTPEHFARCVGQTVNVKTRSGVQGERRISGELVAADDTGITVAVGGGCDPRRLSYAEIGRARLVFEWSTANPKNPNPKNPNPKNLNPKNPNPKNRSSPK